MDSKIKGKIKGEIDVKRFYLPGIIVESKCPKCEHLHEVNMSTQYLSHPVINEPETIGFYCEEDTITENTYCDTDWEVKIKLSMEVELVKDE